MLIAAAVSILCGTPGAVPAAFASGTASGISAAHLREHVQYLSSDELGGRAPASKGERLTLAYLEKQFRDIGYAPGNPDGTYLQKVPLVGMDCVNTPPLKVRGPNGYARNLAYGSEFMCWTLRHIPTSSLHDTPLVFVGYGVVAPEYAWDDYKDEDVHGKIVVMLVNDPPVDNPAVFGGKAMTYYGRWTYKFEEAARHGAAGAILIHNTEAAGYPWAVVQNSWSGEQFDIVRDDNGASRCAVESWITEDAARDLFDAAGYSYNKMIHAAVSRNFQPVEFALTASVDLHNKIRKVTSHNVVARLEGRDPHHHDEHIIYTAHWDHLGTGPAVDGDSIYNGALDNASGVAGMLEVARAFPSHRRELKRSILFVITTAEESGLLGAKYYVEHPLYPLRKAVADINVDGINIWGRTSDMVVVGYGQSDLDQYLARAIAPMGRHIVADAEPEKGYYYRADHFAFAQKGVPALYTDSGVEFLNRPRGWGMKQRAAYVRTKYHKPQDEYDPSWNLSGAVEDLTALFDVGLNLATSTRFPQWSKKSEFRRAREKMMHGASDR